MTTDSDAPMAEWITALGISDAETGNTVARGARERLIAAARHVLSAATSYTTAHVVFQGLLARAQGLHEGAVSATESGNPYAAFTLIRAYAENTAAILSVTDHPAQVDNLWREDAHGIKIGKITNHAETRLAAFRHIYGELSSYAHPASKSLLASMRMAQTRTVQWRSSPAFKSEADRIVAYAWIAELAEASSHLLVEMGANLKLIADVTS